MTSTGSGTQATVHEVGIAVDAVLLEAAAARADDIAAVVSRGGRPDFAGASALQRVRALTLPIVGGNDHQVIELNKAALQAMTCEKRLDIVPDASHLFEESGTLETVAALAVAWFTRHFAAGAGKVL